MKKEISYCYQSNPNNDPELQFRAKCFRRAGSEVIACWLGIRIQSINLEEPEEPPFLFSCSDPGIIDDARRLLHDSFNTAMALAMRRMAGPLAQLKFLPSTLPKDVLEFFTQSLFYVIGEDGRDHALTMNPEYQVDLSAFETATQACELYLNDFIHWPGRTKILQGLEHVVKDVMEEPQISEAINDLASELLKLGVAGLLSPEKVNRVIFRRLRATQELPHLHVFGAMKGCSRADWDHN